MSALMVTVLVASLLGSTHCAGMCGAFVAFAIGVGDPAVRQSRALLLALYQGGRLVTYGALGALAGLVGAGVDLSGRLVGLQRAAAVLAGAMMVAFGLLALLQLAGVRMALLRMPAGLTAMISAVHRRALRRSPPVRALATGLLTTLLPCGWLWAFVITAAGTGSGLAGALLMAAFWAGTLPMLTLVGVGVRKLAGPLASRWPAITASAIVCVGVYTIVGRAHIVLPGAGAHRHDVAGLTTQVQSLDPEDAACCTQPEGGAK
jgi:sulfite exporter TauE/SafE